MHQSTTRLRVLKFILALMGIVVVILLTAAIMIGVVLTGGAQTGVEATLNGTGVPVQWGNATTVPVYVRSVPIGVPSPMGVTTPTP
jgi:hypothetical protein